MSARLAIDAVGALHGGAARVATGAVAAAIRSTAVEDVIVFSSGAARRRFEYPKARKVRVVEVSSDGGGVERVWWLAFGARRLCRRLGVSHALFLGGGGVVDEGVVAGILIQQSLPFVAEGMGRLDAVQRLRLSMVFQMMAWSAAAAAIVLVQSKTMQRAVGERLTGDGKRIRVVRAGPGMTPVGNGPRTGGGRRRGGDLSLVYVGNASTYKNLEVVMDGMSRIERMGRPATLIATLERGSVNPRRARVDVIGYVDEQRLVAAYRAADCLVMPSLSETVCFPLVEAMSNGLPVVAADRPYAREVCESAAVYFDPLNPEDLARAVLEATAEGPRRDRRIEEGYRRAAFWSSPTAYDDLIRAVLEA